MLLKRKRTSFYSATWCRAGASAKLRNGWQIIDGLPKNNFNWYAYKYAATWYLIEGRTGLSAGKGPTIQAACDSLLKSPERMMTWCARAANEPPLGSLPFWEHVATTEEIETYGV
jgi:hypothetical protein